MIGPIIEGILEFIIESIFRLIIEIICFYTGEIILFTVTAGNRKPRWGYYSGESVTNRLLKKGFRVRSHNYILNDSKQRLYL